MYKARVESVNGTKVRAGGKWLTCIGNKPVKVGDSVWTDGRCVYGNNEDCQSPIVITKEELEIPILFEYNHAYTYNKKLQDCTSEIKKRYGIFINNRRKTYSSNSTKIVDVNVNDLGNLYTLSYKSLSKGILITIKKENQIISTLDTSDLSYQIQNDAEKSASNNAASYNYASSSDCGRYLVGRRDGLIIDNPMYQTEETDQYLASIVPSMLFEGYPQWAEAIHCFDLELNYAYTSSNVIAGFIEDENQWWLLLRITGSAEFYGQKKIEMSDPISKHFLLYQNGYWISPLTMKDNTTITRYYLISNSGNYLLSNNEHISHFIDNVTADGETKEITAVRNAVGLPPLQEQKSTENYIEDNSGFIGKKFFMHDGFYFQVNNFFSKECFWEISVYKTTDNPIVNFIVAIESYISASKLGNGNFLIGVSLKPKLFIEHSEFTLEGGLYLLTPKKGEIIQLLKGFINNRCLRPMKKNKHWYENIQSLD